MSKFVPYPWQMAPLADRSLVILLEGSKGGGKSRLWCEKLYLLCKRYSGVMALMVRKTRESMTNSTVLFMDRTVRDNDPYCVHKAGAHRFEFSNGSILAYGGMADAEQREQIRSIGQAGGLDAILMEEAVSFKEEDYNELFSTLRGNAMGWRQMMLATNPEGPMHWIYRRLIMGREAVVYRSSAVDNPANPKDYVENLSRLTGVQRQRLYEGKWVRAEGAIYDNWTERNVDGDIAFYHPDLPVFWSVDDGYKNPRVILFCQELSDGTIIVFDEYYKSEQLPDQTIRECLALPYSPPALIVYDPSAVQFAAQLWNYPDVPLQTLAANNNVSEGIKAVRSYLNDGNDHISLYVHPRCQHTIIEMPTYTWSDSTALQGGDPKPVKENDHSCFPAGTLVKTNLGDTPIEMIGIGDYVLTRKGYRRVLASGLTGRSSKLITLEFSDGRKLSGTPDHPVWANGHYIELRALRYGDILEPSDKHERKYRWRRKRSLAIWLFTKAFSSGATRFQRTTAIGCTIDRIRDTFKMAWKHFIEKSGKTPMGLSQTDMRSITRTAIPQTTTLTILNSCLPPNTDNIMQIFSPKKRERHWSIESDQSMSLLRRGINQRLGVSGIANTEGSLGKTVEPNLEPANTADFNLRLSIGGRPDSVLMPANPHGGAISIWMILRKSVQCVIGCLRPADIAKASAAPVSVVKSYAEPIDLLIPVFNLTVEDAHEYFANGVLVSNCDALRYMVATEHAFRIPRALAG